MPTSRAITRAVRGPKTLAELPVRRLKTNRRLIGIDFLVTVTHASGMSKIYSTLFKSTQRAINDLIKDIRATTGDQGVRYWSWESRSDEDKLPREPLIGLNGFTWDENSGLWLVRFGITISTVDDANLGFEADVIDLVHTHFGQKQKFLMRDPTSGTVINELVVTEFEVMPMTQTQLRNYRTIAIEVKRTGSD